MRTEDQPVCERGAPTEGLLLEPADQEQRSPVQPCRALLPMFGLQIQLAEGTKPSSLNDTPNHLHRAQTITHHSFK